MLSWNCEGYSLEFHGSLESPNKNQTLRSMGLHGIKKAPFQMTQVFHGVPWNIPWNSMELLNRQMKFNLVPWNSMEYSMEFHGTSVSPNEISLSSLECLGTLRLSFYSIPCYPGLSWDFPWNSMKIWSRQTIKKSQGFKWFHWIRRAPFQMTQVFHGIHGIFHGIPWNSGTAKWNTT